MKNREITNVNFVINHLGKKKLYMKNSEITNNMTFAINYLHENLISMDI